MNAQGAASAQGMDAWRGLHVLAAGAVALALGGLAVGFSQTAEVRRPEPVRVTRRVEGLVQAPSYAELRERVHANRLRHAEHLENMAVQRPAPFDLARVDEPGWLRAVQTRAARRAYDGAPPTIPHPVDGRNYPNCTTCHLEAHDIRGRIAPAMSHTLSTNCLQCHVVTEAPMPGPLLEGGPQVATRFEGLRDPPHGTRAWPGAPPTIPHRTFMRERCESCHGVVASSLRTSHPWRQSCNQCHASEAALDQRHAEGLAGGPPLAP